MQGNSELRFFWTMILLLMPCANGVLSGVHGCARHAQSKLKQPTIVTVKRFGNRFPKYSDCRTGANSEILNKHLQISCYSLVLKFRVPNRHCSRSLRSRIADVVPHFLSHPGKLQKTKCPTETEVNYLKDVVPIACGSRTETSLKLKRPNFAFHHSSALHCPQRRRV